MAKVVSHTVQMLPTFGCRCNRCFWDIRLKILRLPEFNMLFQPVLTKFFKNELFSCLPKVDHMIKSCKSLFFGERKASFEFEGHIKLSFKRNSKNSNTRNHTELKIDVRFDKNHLHYNYIDLLNFSIRAQILFNFSWREHAIIGRPAGASEVKKRKWSGVFYSYCFIPFSLRLVNPECLFMKYFESG